jgi:hypothetical protein
VWQIGTRMMKRKAKSAARPEGGKPNKSVVALSIAGLVGALAFWRKTRAADDDS